MAGWDVLMGPFGAHEAQGDAGFAAASVAADGDGDFIAVGHAVRRGEGVG